VRFRDREAHHVFLEPESLDTNEVYCNGISTSLPRDVQDFIIAHLPGCENAKILKYGYAVEYDMAPPHQIDATTMTKRVEGLFLAGQINGTSGYEEAGGQGLVAGLNAVRFVRGEELIRLGRDSSYIGVMLDDLVTKTPREPYRMFTSRAEFRLLLRADNAPERLTNLGRDLGLICDDRWSKFNDRARGIDRIHASISNGLKVDGILVRDLPKRGDVSFEDWFAHLPHAPSRRLAFVVYNDLRYASYIERQYAEQKKLAEMERRRIPDYFDYAQVRGLRNEAKEVLAKFRPTTLGQAGRLAGVNPADVTLLAVALDANAKMQSCAS